MNLVCLKRIFGSDCDYALVLPNVSEYDLIEFLTGPEVWHDEVIKEGFLLWISDLHRKGVTSLLGYPLDDALSHFCTNPKAAGFQGFISQKLNQRFLEEEGFR